jgi:aryl-alcohol dehydrogenase-like predicted oxidoreductase
VRKRRLGKTGLEVSELTLGTWGLSGDGYGPVPEREMDRTIDRAVALGINLFDTADVYGRGDMERRLGKRLPVGKTHVITKIGTNLEEGYPKKQFDEQYLFMAFEKSQERLRREEVEVVLLHNPSLATMKKDEPFGVLAGLKDKGRIRAWGVAAGSVAVAEKAMERGADVLEMAYNCFFFKDVRSIGSKAASQQIAILARSVLAHGLLAGHWSPEREFYPGDHRAERWNPDDVRRRVEQLGALRSVVGGPAPTMRSVALRFVLENQRITSAVLGPRSYVQLDQLVRDAGRMPPYLSRLTLAKLETELATHGVTGG